MKDRYEAKEQESLIKKFWQDKNVFVFDRDSSKPVFSIDTPPPTVSGSLHIGHIFSYLHTDFVARYKKMTGHNVYYPMGFDDNGLPTEKFVEKKLKIRSKDLKRSEFISTCLNECLAVEETFKDLWKSIGLSVDWNYCYTTISPKVRAVSQKNFLQMLRKGLVYRKQEPALFCTDFQTTVAQAELDTIETNSFFNTLKFDLVGTAGHILIATTRPELLPACVAIFVNPQDARYSDLIGKEVRVPLFNQIVKIMADDAVVLDKGTGIVMCCTFGDQQDVVWFKKHNLPLIEVVGQNGRMTNRAGFLEGQKVHQARTLVIEALKEQQYLIEQKPIKHDVHIYERSKKEIEYIVSWQWFVKVLDFKEQLLKAGSEIIWHPSFMKHRYDDWVKNLNWDWCISRQRYFGIPFPIWHCSDCKGILVPDESLLPVDPVEQSFPGGNCNFCGSSNVIADTDVMDTWATSSSTPQINAAIANLSTDSFLPMSIRPQAHDIIRTWAFYTIAKSVHIESSLPWKEILVSGHVLAGDKEKISKSLGNSQLTPQGLIESFSADAIRFWAAKGRLGLDTMFAPDQLKNGNRLVTKLWNAMKFAYENILASKIDFSQDIILEMPSDLDALSKYLFYHLYRTAKIYHQHYVAYEYSSALEALDLFFWHTFCDNYLEIVKDQVFNPDKYDENTVKNYVYTLYVVGLEILKMYAPFIPFVTERIYQTIFAGTCREVSLHQHIFDLEHLHKFKFKQVAKEFEIVIDVLAAVRKLKSENSLSLKTECSQLVVFANDSEILKKDLTVLNLLLGVTKCKTLVLSNSAALSNSLAEIESGFVVHVNLENKG